VTSGVGPAGPFRIYLGAAAGTGKTVAMLGEGQRRRERGADVVIAFVEPHGRSRRSSWAPASAPGGRN
jgi:two-component system, OmpR family, sensor histidine kinase KdpD